MNKVKKFISVVLCIALLSGVGVQQVFAEGKISNVEQNEEVVLDDQNVKDNNEVTGEIWKMFQKKIRISVIRKFHRKTMKNKSKLKLERMKR